MTKAITNTEYLIDSRDIIERIEFLKELEVDGLRNGRRTLSTLQSVELDTLESVNDECSEFCADWEYGTTLIRATDFVQYAKELAEDLGVAPSGSDVWPARHIDWDAAADELSIDYTAIDFGGEDYFVR